MHGVQPLPEETFVHIVNQSTPLENRLAAALQEVRPPAALLKRVAEVLADEDLLLVAGDLAPMGFGAYDGQLCLVTPNRVILVTATHVQSPDSAFGVEEWDREIGPLLHLHPVLPPAPREG